MIELERRGVLMQSYLELGCNWGLVRRSYGLFARGFGSLLEVVLVC